MRLSSKRRPPPLLPPPPAHPFGFLSFIFSPNWRLRSSLGEIPSDMTPRCESPASPPSTAVAPAAAAPVCICCASLLGTPCTSQLARRALRAFHVPKAPTACSTYISAAGAYVMIAVAWVLQIEDFFESWPLFRVAEFVVFFICIWYLLAVTAFTKFVPVSGVIKRSAG
jgi:hypothetical protein